MRLREGKQWRPAKVVKPTPEPRSYLVEADGQQYRRNRRELIKTEEDTPACTEGKGENTKRKERRYPFRNLKPKERLNL